MPGSRNLDAIQQDVKELLLLLQDYVSQPVFTGKKICFLLSLLVVHHDQKKAWAAVFLELRFTKLQQDTGFWLIPTTEFGALPPGGSSVCHHLVSSGTSRSEETCFLTLNCINAHTYVWSNQRYLSIFWFLCIPCLSAVLFEHLSICLFFSVLHLLVFIHASNSKS